MKTIYLIACGATKAPCVSKAKDLYLGQLFLKARAYVEAKGAKLTGADDRWFILSAKWGLLHPDSAIKPYDLSLNGKDDSYLESWSLTVCLQLLGKFQPEDKIVIFAGKNYRKFLIPKLKDEGLIVEIPLEGLGLGQQLAWLKKEIENETNLRAQNLKYAR